LLGDPEVSDYIPILDQHINAMVALTSNWKAKEKIDARQAK